MMAPTRDELRVSLTCKKKKKKEGDVFPDPFHTFLSLSASSQRFDTVRDVLRSPSWLCFAPFSIPLLPFPCSDPLVCLCAAERLREQSFYLRLCIVVVKAAKCDFEATSQAPSCILQLGTRSLEFTHVRNAVQSHQRPEK